MRHDDDEGLWSEVFDEAIDAGLDERTAGRLADEAVEDARGRHAERYDDYGD